MLRIQTPLSNGLEALIHDVIGCCITVHRATGPGLVEKIYLRATRRELQNMGIPFESEKTIPVMYRDQVLCHQKLDIVVKGQLILEIKAVERLNPVHRAQVICYLKISRLPVALLINFNVPVLKDGLERFVSTQ
jgi:GxxExxY protein